MKSRGILLPVFSLPGKYEIGCFSEEAYRFVDFLSSSGQRYWQILPLGPTGFGESPYSPLSTFAGNHYFIDPDTLLEKGLVTEDEIATHCSPCADSSEVNYPSLLSNRFKLLSLAFERFSNRSAEYAEFVEKNSYWLEDYAVFMLLKHMHSGSSFTEWEPEYRDRESGALFELKKTYAKAIDFYKWLQFEFYREWSSLRSYANSKGIKIIGDIPFYMGTDCADVWSRPRLFELDDECNPTCVAGAPGNFDYPEQKWGNPVYRWETHAEDGFKWWISRVRNSLELFDVIRFDHFIGFDRYFYIPASGDNGRFENGPGIQLFDAIKKELGEFPAIAEDLGTKFDTTDKLLAEVGFPPMIVVQHAIRHLMNNYGSCDIASYLQNTCPQNCVIYTGTHDNETIVQFIQESDENTRRSLADHLSIDNSDDYNAIADGLISVVLSSPADLCIIPMGDYLHMDSRARINEPGTIGNNWKWRMGMDSLSAIEYYRA